MPWIQASDDLYALGLNLGQPLIVSSGCPVVVPMRFSAPRRWRVRRRARARGDRLAPA